MNLSDQTNLASNVTPNGGTEMDIPFDKLHISSKNTRTKPHTQQDIECRAASIKAYGILNRLQVIIEPVPGSDKEYGIVAGGGRYLSLELLVNKGVLPTDFPVKCDVRPVDEAIAISLAENTNRAPLHEADEFVAFKAMADEGKAIETIAEHFGINVRTVQQRLRLGGLHPQLIDLYRNGKLDAEQVRAFCRTSDQERQLQVWNSLTQYERSAWYIRNKLARETLDTSDPMVKFVGLDLYREAGGVVTTDLFSQGDEGIVEDVALLHQLAVDKLRGIANEIVASEGWSWSDITESLNHRHRSEFDEATAESRAPTEQEQVQLDKLTAERESLIEKRDSLQETLDQMLGEQDDCAGQEEGATEGSSTDALQQQVDEVEARIETVESAIDTLRASFVTYADNVRAVGGVIVALDGRGGVEVVRGLIRRVQAEPEESSAQPAVGSTPSSGLAAASSMSRSTSSAEATPAKKGRPEVSERLANQLSAHRTAVMQVLMMNRPDVAMAATVQRLLEAVSRRHRYSDNDALKISGRSSLDSLHDKASDLNGMRASVEIKARIDAWRARIPAKGADELGWLLSLDSAELHELFALCVALSLDATTGDASRMTGTELAGALQVDVADYWEATEMSYFSAVPKDAIIAAVEDACGPGSGMPMIKMKKGDAAKYAEQKLAGTRWLPAMLRTQAVAAPLEAVAKESLPEAAPQIAETADAADVIAVDAYAALESVGSSTGEPLDAVLANDAAAASVAVTAVDTE
ncbi:ParB N-terminal domain-containing protein [Massilia sp.]|uniref:ParB/RepB/Spo0J family partition protein n=1 Tax=Massilia sp. TaxID=1882437 RepID=UPI00352FC6AD